MQITVEYAAQLKRAAGTARETFDLDSQGTLAELVRRIAQRHGEAMRAILLDEKGNLHPSILAFVNGEQCRDSAARELQEGDTVAFLPPISGG